MTSSRGAYIINNSSSDVPVSEDATPPEGLAPCEVRQHFSNLTITEQTDVIRRCCRYMLVSNVSKKPVKRRDLYRMMFNGVECAENKPMNNTMFTEAFNSAQEKFRNVFGMELKEIKKPVGMSKLLDLQKRSEKKHQRTTYTRAYILVSNLPRNLRPEPAEEDLAVLGFITVVASMILSSPGCRLDEQTLHFNLKRIGVHVHEEQGHHQLNQGNVKQLLEKKLVEQWYFLREQKEDKFFYSLGPRLRAELDDDHLIAFVNAVYLEGDSSNDSKGLDENAVNELKMRLNEAAKQSGLHDNSE